MICATVHIETFILYNIFGFIGCYIKFSYFIFSQMYRFIYFVYRFTRRGVDPAPLAENGLVTELLTRLSNAAGPVQTTCTGPSKF